MSIDELVAQARESQAQGKHDNQLADQLAAAATQHYGADNRSPELLQIIKLSSSLREIKKPEWRTEFEVLEIGSIPPPQEPGYFYISQYGFGRVDLLKDGQRVNRIYDIVLKLDAQDVRTRLPNRYTTNFGERNHINVRARKRRGVELLKRIKADMNFTPINGCYAMLLETDHNSDSTASLVISDIEIVLGSVPVKQVIIDALAPISQYIAENHLNVRQVGSVVDGGHRYKR